MPRPKEPYNAVGGRAAHAWVLPPGCWRGKRYVVPEFERDWRKIRKELQSKLESADWADLNRYARLLEKWEQAFLHEQFYARLQELAKLNGQDRGPV